LFESESGQKPENKFPRDQLIGARHRTFCA
jgi:hypothetical protein